MIVTSRTVLNFFIILLIIINIVKCSSEKLNQTEEKLSRKKRYLIFPRGASVQMVYDQIIPIVDYTNLFILGVTCALAWELPENPVHLNEELMAKYKNGTLPLLLRKDENVTEDNNQIMTNNNYGYDSFYNNNYNNQKFNVDDWNDEADNRIEFGSKFYEPWQEKISETSSGYNDYYNRQSPILPIISEIAKKPWHRHRVYPAIGKRSVTQIVPTKQSFEEIFYLNYHRTSRHSLYKSIEKYLKAQNKDGVECLHKALCLTGQMKHDNEPGTFIAEIMRTIFSLPSTPLLNTRHNHEHKQYDDAYFRQQNCTEIYPKCPDNLYEADFIF